MKTRLVILFLLISTYSTQAQLFGWGSKTEKPTPELLLMDRAIQFETTTAVNNMYNFNFYEAEKDFKWIRVKYFDHPLGNFLLGLNEWWKIVPDTKNTAFDDNCHTYMDLAIDKADKMLNKNSKNKEAAFFLAAAYSIKGRLYAEREKWIKAAWAGKQSLKYLDMSRGEENINPELLFGDGVYNYYSKWIHENYKSLKPLLSFFRKGDKNLGIKQLEHVANNAFYSRMEARYFLIQIYAMENQPMKSLIMARQMHALYPNNSFFHRYVARNSFALGRIQDAEIYATELLDNLKANKYGYGDNDGRYGAYILGYINDFYNHDYTKAKYYYIESINYAINNDSKETGFYVSANNALGKISEADKDYKAAVEYYTNALKNSEKKSKEYILAQERLRAIIKIMKNKK